MILDKLGSLCEYILFDDAWGGYENFIPLLKDAAVLTFPLNSRAPGILVTQSVHKQLAGLSMTSQIHKKTATSRITPITFPMMCGMTPISCIFPPPPTTHCWRGWK